MKTLPWLLVAYLVCQTLIACGGGDSPVLAPDSGEADPADASVNADADAHAHADVDVADGGSPCAEVTSGELLAHVHAFVGMSEQSKARGDLVWGRIAGEPAAAAAAQYVADQFNASGLTDLQGHTPVAVQPIRATTSRWWLSKLGLTLGGDAYKFTTISTFFESKTTSGAGLTAEVVDVGDGTSLPAGLEGKIALVESTLGWSVASGGVDASVVENLVTSRAAGMILWMNKPGFPDDATYAYPVPLRSATKIVWQMMGMKEGLYLKKYIADHPGGAATATLVVEGRDISDWSTENVVGVLPGNGSRDEYVLVMAHTDSVFDGANDNATGLANMVAMAKHFSAVPRSKRTRTVIFAATGSHHYGPGIGASALARWLPSQIPDFYAKCALVLNAEHLGARNLAPGGNEFVYVAGVTEASGPVPRATLATMMGAATEAEQLESAGGISTSVKGDGQSLYVASDKRAEVMSFMELFSSYHTDKDTEANLDAAKFLRASRAVCRVVEQLTVDSR